MTSRRKFLKQGLTAGAVIATSSLPVELFAGTRNKTVSLTILHTNDVHSRLDAFPIDHPKYPGMGGVAKRASLINKVRAQEENVLLLDSGDIVQGTPYFNFYNGVPEIEMMNKLGYDFATIGNHDFDAGIDQLAELASIANFKFVNSNYNFSETPMEQYFTDNGKYQVVEKDGLRIGIFGLGVELNGLVPAPLFGKTTYLDPLKEANSVADKLVNEDGCDLVICLSHLGYEYDSARVSDMLLAKNSDNVDVILGGHTHTFLDEATVVKNLSGKPVIINQVGWAGLVLGRLDLQFDRVKKRKKIKSSPVIIR